MKFGWYLHMKLAATNLGLTGLCYCLLMNGSLSPCFGNGRTGYTLIWCKWFFGLNFNKVLSFISKYIYIYIYMNMYI